jgi:hypothetical protein
MGASAFKGQVPQVEAKVVVQVQGKRSAISICDFSCGRFFD